LSKVFYHKIYEHNFPTDRVNKKIERHKTAKVCSQQTLVCFYFTLSRTGVIAKRF